MIKKMKILRSLIIMVIIIYGFELLFLKYEAISNNCAYVFNEIK